jgi:glutamate-5-semialdehyde dehydrogenase
MPGNAVILKGGSEAVHSLTALHEAIRTALASSKTPSSVPVDAVQLLFSRSQVAPLLKLDRLIDLVIPRGSNTLVRYIQENTRIPGMRCIVII